MIFFVNTSSGCIELNVKHRSKKALYIDLHTGYSSRKILALCSSIKDPIKCIPFIERIDQTSHNHNAVCFCMMLEKAAELEPKKDIQAIRLIMLELERIYSHIVYLYELLSCLEDDVISDRLIGMRYLLIDCFEEIVGHRMFGTAHIFSGLSFNLTPGNIKLINETTESLDESTKVILDIFIKNTSISSLFSGLAIVDPDLVIGKDSKDMDIKLTGPISWSHDSVKDLRISEPYLLYDDIEIQNVLKSRDIQHNKNSNSAYSRIFTILSDIDCSLKIILLANNKYSPSYQISDQLPKLKIPKNTFLEQRIEAPRGVVSISASTDRNGLIDTINVLSPSDINKSTIPLSLKGTITDYIEIAFKSLYISPMEIDK